MAWGLVELDIPPGVYRAGTRRQSKGRWDDQLFIRWSEGVMAPEGGWAARTTSAITGMGRCALVFVSNALERWITVACQSKLYACTSSETSMHDITPVGLVAGAADATAAGGYGSGPYGAGLYGTPRISLTGAIQDATIPSLDTFGQDLVANWPQDGKIYYWQRNTAVVAATLTNAPTGCCGVLVTPEKHVVALGAGGDARTIAWSDQEAATVWTPASTNQAGDIALATQGRIMCGRRLRDITLVWTDLDVHGMSYLGQPYIFSVARLGENCGIISRGAVAVSDTRAMWMSLNGFYMYDGYVQPVVCDVYDQIFGDINMTQRSKFTAHHRGRFNEVHFLYVSSQSTEIDRRAVFNYKEAHWRVHDISGMDATRLCGVDSSLMDNPILVGSDGILYDHETGFAYDGLTPYATAVGFSLGAGDHITRVRRVIPDGRTQGEVQLTFYARSAPEGATTTFGPYQEEDFMPVRFSGREIDMKVEFTTVSANSRWGIPRLEVIQGGKR